MTNYEKIKNMSVEEMAGFIRTIRGGNFTSGGVRRIDGDKVQWEEIEQWLTDDVVNYATSLTRERIFAALDEDELSCIDVRLCFDSSEHVDAFVECILLRKEGILVRWGDEYRYAYSPKGKRLTKEQKTYIESKEC